LPGVLGNEASPLEETFKEGLLEHPLYTRPREFDGKPVPEVLVSGNHKKIDQWRRQQQILRTLQKRPDLLSQAAVTKDEILGAQGDLQLRKNVAVGLVHYPVYNKAGEVVATNVTNLDIHDIARACRTYGVDQFYIITPAEEQLAFVGRVLEHWQSGRGIQYNPVRKDSLVNTKVAHSLEAALEDWGGNTKLVATSAREVAGPKPIKFPHLREIALKERVFLVFGTGWGLENTLVRRVDYLLEPIRGRSPDGFRHLSVRSAVSIILDRLFGPCY
jgi:tRNA (guanine37-N1)-methyltransferase